MVDTSAKAGLVLVCSVVWLRLQVQPVGIAVGRLRRYRSIYREVELQDGCTVSPSIELTGVYRFTRIEVYRFTVDK